MLVSWMFLLLLSSSFLCSCSHKTCQKLMFRDSVPSVQSPHYPNNYTHNLSCNYKIKLPENTRIKLKFRVVKLEKKDKKGRCHDYLKIYDGLSSRSPVIQNKFCGDGEEVINRQIISSSNKLKINFFSDERYSNKGFEFSYESYDVCPNVIMRQSRSSIKSPDYPNNYTKNLNCIYKIQLPKNTRIQLIFREVKLQKENSRGKCHDYIEVYDGFATWVPIIQKQFCGNGKGVVNQPIISSSNRLSIRFVTDSVHSNKGFELTYDPYQPPKVTDVTQKVTGVVIGTACGLVFLILTFLAICHSRHLTLLRRRGSRRCEIASTDGFDPVEQRGPPSYYDVMSSPDKYPLTPSGQKKSKRSCDGDDLPRYSKLVFLRTLLDDSGQEDLEQNISQSISTDV